MSGESLATLVDEYYERFSSKMCCFDDLLPYLNVLSLAEQASLHEKSLVLTALSGDLVSEVRSGCLAHIF